MSEVPDKQERSIALVTGANQGIGLAIAQGLAARGLTVLVGSRHIENGMKAAAAIDGDAHAIQLDVIAVTQAMLPLLRKSSTGRIVNVSSSRASMTLASDPEETRRREMFGVTYSSSKVALNAITLAFALDLESSGIKVNAAAPGFTVTAMNNFEGRRSTEEAAREPIRLALLGPDGPTGTFSDENGLIPW